MILTSMIVPHHYSAELGPRPRLTELSLRIRRWQWPTPSRPRGYRSGGVDNAGSLQKRRYGYDGTRAGERCKILHRHLRMPSILSARGMYDPVVVFDTVVFVRALINPHSFLGRLVFEHFNEYRLIVTPQILREYVEVLQRPELTSRFSTLKGIDVARILKILQKAEVDHT